MKSLPTVSDSTLIPGVPARAVLGGAGILAAAAMVSGIEPRFVVASTLLLLGAQLASIRSLRDMRPDPILVVVVLLMTGRWLHAPSRWMTEWTGTGLAGAAAVILVGGALRSSPVGLMAQATAVLGAVASFTGDTAVRDAFIVGCVVTAAVAILPAPPERRSPTFTALASGGLAALGGSALIAAMATTTTVDMSLLPVAAAAAIGLVSFAVRWPRLGLLLGTSVQRRAMAKAAAPALEISESGQILERNQAAEYLLPNAATDANPMLESMMTKEHWGALRAAMIEARETDRAHTAELELTVKGLTPRNMVVSVTVLPGDGEHSWVLTMDDRTDLIERDAAQRAELSLLQRRITMDSLTGVANRAGIVARLNELLRDEGATVLFFDLDGFKAVNDTHGHGAGDAVLIAIARRLGAMFSEPALFGRLGGDEFVVVGPRREVPDSLFDAIREAVATPVAYEGKRLEVGTSIGVAHTDRGGDADQVLQSADNAMYSDKASRKAGRTAV